MFPELRNISALMATVGYYGDFYVAGGYFRDKLNRRPFKDVDVFVPGPADPATATADDLVRYDVTCAQEIEANGTVYNIVFLGHQWGLKGILDRMDIGLCQIGMGRDGQVYCTEAYLADVKNNTLTILAEPVTPADFDHIERVKAKYPDMTVVEAFVPTPPPPTD